MISVRVTDLGTRQLSRARKCLRAMGANEDIVRTFPTISFQEKALAYIKALTPVGEHGDNRDTTQIANRALRDQWRAARTREGQQIAFKIWSLLETIGGSRGLAKLRSIDAGSSQRTLVAKRTFSFKNALGGFPLIKAGSKVNRPARAALDLTGKTARYIEEELVPEIRESTRARLTQRLNNFEA